MQTALRNDPEYKAELIEKVKWAGIYAGIATRSHNELKLAQDSTRELARFAGVQIDEQELMGGDLGEHAEPVRWIFGDVLAAILNEAHFDLVKS